MTKYHIKEDGTPGKCSAKSLDSCPRAQSGDNFHGTREEVEAESQNRFQNEHGNFSTVSKEDSLLAYTNHPNGGDQLMVGELLANVKEGNELVIRRFSPDSEEAESYAQGTSPDRDSAYWDIQDKVNGSFVFPVKMFRDDMSLEQVSNAVELILQDEPAPMGYNNGFVIAEVSKQNLAENTNVKARYEMLDSGDFEEFYASPDSQSPFRDSQTKYGEKKVLNEFLWKKGSKAEIIHGLYGAIED